MKVPAYSNNCHRHLGQPSIAIRVDIDYADEIHAMVALRCGNLERLTFL